MLLSRLVIAAACASCLYAQSPDGVWLSQESGTVYEIRGPVLTAFELTSRSCVKSFTARRPAGKPTTFQERGGDTFLVSPGMGPDSLSFQREGGLGTAIDRLPALPALCREPASDTPESNFEVFVRTFAEHYVSFDRRGIDWEKATAESRSKISARTTPPQLFDVLSSMIRPLADIHTGIEAGKPKREFEPPLRPGCERLTKGSIDHFAKSGRRELFAITDRAYLSGRIQQLCNGQLGYGWAGAGIGYLRILGFGNYSRHGGEKGSMAALEAALDGIFSQPELQGLIIDLRLSFGGDDIYGMAMAARLTDRDYTAAIVRARFDPVDRERWTEGQPVTVRPAARPGFRGPVVVLIGPITMSAAEDFTLALMGRTPRATLIGESTQGVATEYLERRLPNGWSFTVPNAVWRTPGGDRFDALGIPPDVAAPVFADDDVAAGRDPGMAAALRILRRR